MMKAPMRLCCIVSVIVFLFLSSGELRSARAGEGPVILVRCDDIGMCHTVNMAFKEVLERGMPVSASVMFACPWYQEAVDILKNYKNVSVGVHLTLNAEWKSYRWGPVAGRSAVPGLVDADGYFFPSRAELFANKPKMEEFERELRAQLDRAVHSGLKLDYLDYHMGTAVDNHELRLLVERLAKEYHLGVSRWFGEEDLGGWYAVPPAEKKAVILSKLDSLGTAAARLVVFHIGQETPEMNALADLNSFGLKGMSQHRAAELGALLSPEFRAKVSANHITMKNYGDLVREVGLDRMKMVEKEE